MSLAAFEATIVEGRVWGSDLAERGNIIGTPVVGAIGHFQRRYGNAALHEAVTRLAPKWRAEVQPNAPGLGLLPSRWYPHPFAGDIVRAMVNVVRPANEDLLVRELATAGIEASLSTAMRVLLRYTATPAKLAERAQDSWNMFYDSGRVHVVVINDHEYGSHITEWAQHDAWICRISLEVTRRLVERTGARIEESMRTQCVGWGGTACGSLIRWAR